MLCDRSEHQRNTTGRAIRRSVLLIAACSALTAAHGQDTVTVYWIGNSLTATNNVPDTTAAMVNRGSSQQQTFIGSFDESYIWGQTLSYHWHNSYDSNQISESQYNYVVLQDFVPYNQDTVFCYYRKFTQVVQNHGGTPVVACIWPSYGSSSNQWNYFISLFDRVADSCRAAFAPLAVAWRNVLTEKPDYPLYVHAYDTTDIWHPSTYGSYLCDCVYYHIFTGDSPVGNSVTGGMSSDTAAYLQLKAWEVCDSISSTLATSAPGGVPSGVRNLPKHEPAAAGMEFFDLHGRRTTRATHTGLASPGLALRRTVLSDGSFRVVPRQIGVPQRSSQGSALARPW